ncbi:MAG: permease prefix domain 1-containing protein [Clostridia bacterium]
MENRIKNYVDSLFADVPNTRQTRDLMDEMNQNLIEKYHDLLSRGYSEESAYTSAINGIGDVNELIAELKRNHMQSDADAQKQKRAYAIRVAIAVALYILSVIPVIVLPSFDLDLAGVVVMFIMIAAATGIIVYAGMTKPKYNKADDTIVENFKEWNSQNSNKVSLRRAISSALWCVSVVLYFVISFGTGSWHITWVIFLIAVAIDNIISAAFSLHKSR